MMSVTYSAVLPVREETVDFLAGLLAAERVRLGSRGQTRSLAPHTGSGQAANAVVKGNWRQGR
jgi:hypothetical protein